MSDAQEDLDVFTPETTSIDITRTIRLKLATSTEKNKTIQQGIDAYQQVLSFMADRLPTYPEYQWRPHNNQMYHQAKRGLPDDNIEYKSTLALQAQKQVAEAFVAWRERGK